MKNFKKLILILIIISCQSNEEQIEFVKSNTLKQDLETVKKMKIYFGHQSVGNNIIAGIKDLYIEQEILDFKIITLKEIQRARKLPQGYFLHSKIGKNKDPKSKCTDFTNNLKTKVSPLIDYAFMKFCYIDINENTDVNKLFEYYKIFVKNIKQKHPNLTFIHITAPLRHSPEGFSIKIREILGKPNRSKLANIKRNEFNELIIKHFFNDPIFDLAKEQSTYINGKRSMFKREGKLYPKLIDEYTYDGGHLNKLGRKVIAQALVNFLAETNKNKNLQ